MKRIFINIQIIAVLLISLSAFAQQQDEDLLTATFEDQSKPGKVEIRWSNGDVTVKSYDGKEVKVELMRNKRRSRRNYSKYSDMRKIYDGDAVEIEKNGNVISIECHTLYRHVDAEIFIPENSELYFVNGLNGAVEIEDINTEIEVETLNGDIYLKNISGSVTAYSTNGEIVASMKQLKKDDTLILTTLNDDIDLELPVEINASLSMTTRDEIYTDFDVTPVTKGTERWRSRSRNRLEYSINGGGIDIQLKSMHGDIYVRKNK